MTHKETAALIAAIMAAYPGKVNIHDPEATARIWSRMLVDVSVDEAMGALEEHLAMSAFPPMIADLRTRIAEKRSPAPDIGAAWEEVRRAVQSVGRYRVPTWTSDRVAGAVNAIGWEELCDCPIDQLGTMRAQFERYYRAGVDTERKAANVGSLESARSGAGALPAGQILKSLPRGGEGR